MEVAVLLFTTILAAAPLAAATVLAHRMGRRGLWKVWPSVVAILFGLAMSWGSNISGEGPKAFLGILSGGYVGCLALLLALVVMRAAPKPDMDVF